MPPLSMLSATRERVEEAGADRRDVEGDAVVDAERGLDQGGARPERSGPGSRWRGRSGRSAPASTPAAASALRAASVARVAVVSPSPAMWRAWMPVRSTIHSCGGVDAARRAPALVTRRGGRAEPVPTMTERRLISRPTSWRAVRRDVGEILGDLAGQVLAHHPRRHAGSHWRRPCRWRCRGSSRRGR